MTYYYYPLCSKDFTFENVFASESVSPHVFYSKRGFGIDYFYKIPKAHHDKAIILFEEPPVYETGSENPSIVKFILAIERNYFDDAQIVKANDGIVAYQKTIYLDKKNFKILFFSEEEKKVTCLRSETSLPTKGFKKYISNFQVIAESDCKKYDYSIIEQLKIDNTALRDFISDDRLYNSFKGLIYGVTSGMLNEKSTEEIAIKRSFQEIINCFAELKNRKDNESKGLGTRYSKTFGVDKMPLKVFYDKLLNAIIISEKVFYDQIPRHVISEDDLANYLLSIKSNRLSNLEDARRYVTYRILDDELFSTDYFQQLKTMYLGDSGKKDPSIYFEKLKSLAGRSMAESIRVNWNSEKKATINLSDDFKETLHELTSFADPKFSTGKSIKEINLEAIRLNIENNEILIDAGFGDLTGQEMEEYQMIVNVILRTAKFGKGGTNKEIVLSIVEETGNKTNKNEGKQTRLYRYLNNEINDYSVEKATSIVMKNFVAFVFNVDSLENLQNYTEAKGIDKRWMSCSFWCLFNGFANTSGNFLKVIFDSDSVSLQNHIDSYLMQIRSNDFLYETSSEEMVVSESPSPSYSIEREKSDQIPDRVEEFYNKHVQDKYDISLEKFISIFQTKNKEFILKELKDDHKVLKKDGKKLIELFNDHVSSTTLF